MRMLRSGLKKPSAIAKSTTHTPFTEPIERVDSAIPCASREDICFKENITVNRSEPPKLSMEPQQMKRKKNGGGCNLRKSIAWDRAFLTEEGVLDPIELSIISGSPFREGLPVMAGNTRDSLQSKSTNFQEVKDKLSRKPPDEYLGKNQRKYCLSQRLDSSSSNVVTSHKVKTCVGSKSRSRCSGSPHPPLPLPSLKRSAILKTEETASMGIKLQKVPSSRTDPSPAQTTFKSNIPNAECVNTHQVSLPDFSIQINAGTRSFSKDLKTTQIALKASSLQPMCHLEAGLGNSSSKGHVNTSRALGEKSDESSVSNIIPDNVTCKPQYSLESHDKTVTSAVCLAQHARNNDKIKHYSQNQSTKSSGLRMPSPSLSFFSQPKASAVRDLPRDTPTAICWSQKPGVISLQDSSSRTVKKDNNIPDRTISSDGMALSPIPGCLAPSLIHDASHITAELNLENSSRQMTGMKVSDDIVSSDERGYKLIDDYALRIQDLPIRRTKRISPEIAGMLKEIPEMPSQGGNCEHVTDDINLKIDCCPVEGEVCRSELRNAGCVLENYDVHGCDTSNETEEWSTGSSLVLTDGAVKGPQCEVVVKLSKQNLLVVQEQTHKPNVFDPNVPHEDENILSDGVFRGPRCGDVIGLSEQNLLVTQEQADKLNSPDKSILRKDEYISSAEIREIKVHQKSHEEVSSCGESARFEDEVRSQPTIKYQHSGCVVDTIPNLEDNGGKNCSTFVMPLKERGSNIYIQSGKEADTVLVQSPDINKLECFELLDTLTPSGILSPINDGLQFENPLLTESSRSICIPNGAMSEVYEGISSPIDELRLKLDHCKDHNELGNVDGYFTERELHIDSLRESSVSEQEQQHGRCSLADGNDTGADSSRISTSIKVNEDSSSSVDELEANLDHVQAKDSSSPMMHALHESNDCRDGLNEKRRLVIPPNAIPFSDEWLAAMEAAGEDILTKKSGAVQNSPTDKSVPDPSPWSPVKRKNNQIGPYDCTKHQHTGPGF